MNVVLLRVGIDTGSGGMHAPLFVDGSFEFMPIPDGFSGTGVDERTYGNTLGRRGVPLSEYFPPRRRPVMAKCPMHVDPEFDTYTYGDPSPLKARLRHLEPGDLLAFYSGLEGWDAPREPALYLVGYFEVAAAGRASEFDETELRTLFERNFHVRHLGVFKEQKERLVLVKGSPASRLLDQAVCISQLGTNRYGGRLYVLSENVRTFFGDFGGRVGIPRSSPRWVRPDHVERAAAYLRSL